MQTDFILQMRPSFGEEERDALLEYMDGDGFVTEYKKTTLFEQMIAEYTGAKHCIVVNNGTISLTLAAMALEIKAGDEVIVPNYTMIATPNSMKLFGAEPVFVDVEAQTLCLDIELVRRALTEKTRAIALVSANGRYPAAGIETFRELAQKHSLLLIEDAAQSLGSYYPEGTHIGRMGQAGTFSFSVPKIISTGQGGAVITDADEVAWKVRRLKDFGRASGGNDIHDTIGYNFKFTDLQACIGIEQMKKLPARRQRKIDIWTNYKERLKGVDEVRLFEHDVANTAPWFVDCLVKDRAGLAGYLKQNRIGTRVMYPPIHKQRAYQQDGQFPVSEDVGERGLWLPSSVDLSDEQIGYICTTITNYYVGRP